MPPQSAAATSPRNPALDGLRGFAVLLVFAFHYGGGLKSPHPAIRVLGIITQAGWTGVVLFFALSGFLITGSLWDSLQQTHLLRNFYARRALRILPLYYLALLAAFLFSVARGTTFAEMQPLALYIFFLQNVPGLAAQASAFVSSLPIYHLWSLAVEEQFYLLWPLLLLLARKRGRALHLCLWIFLFSALFRVVTYGLLSRAFAMPPLLFDTFLLTNAGPLVLGAALALNLRNPDPHPTRTVERLAAPVFALGLLIFLLIGLHLRSLHLEASLQFMIGLPAVSLAAAALIPLAMRPGLTRRLFSFRPLGWLGRISYGFYIFHVLLQPVFDGIGVAVTHTDLGATYQTVRLLAAFPITLAVSWLSYQIFELPFLHFQRHFPLRPPLPSD